MSLLSLNFTGCGVIRPYNKPHFEEIGTSETAFLVPLTGDISDQSVFESEELLNKSKVATKRVEIPREWVQTGRFRGQGEYKDTMALIKVDRTSVSREWTEADGTEATNQSIVAESKEGTSLTIGMSCIASIKETDISKFLYNYNKKTLAEIMDTEIRTTVETKMNTECAKRTLDEIKTQKDEIMSVVTQEVEEIFSAKGISIDNLGLKDFTVPENIQKAWDDKVIAEKEAEAQAIENQKNIDKAKADAEAIKEQASTMTEQIQLKEAEAKVIEANAKLKQAEAMKEWKNVQVIGDNSIISELK